MKPTDNSVAFGAPGIEPRWTSSTDWAVNSVIKFTFFWKRDQRWQGENFQVSVL
jgi:hypothetical protein